ncbi:conserved Plasmodium protein, unknown function [Plasmodium ovale wallikeri]|uniref:Uncharacterized protein n=2 Tax=Plasmodium ovale TaxID=36330 RepID=A0A1A8YGK0_PLAOA|nr:conserved Plasmodium protein, unknown function [Plasmodium ovale wallikeri]SBT31312.1 conserved Plasmodium protein, unknown function [Plasmodium ovale wallikeri]SBT75307.1 conserved Plasmodium protein, unknown function [Plasmodium ovale]
MDVPLSGNNKGENEQVVNPSDYEEEKNVAAWNEGSGSHEPQDKHAVSVETTDKAPEQEPEAHEPEVHEPEALEPNAHEPDEYAPEAQEPNAHEPNAHEPNAHNVNTLGVRNQGQGEEGDSTSQEKVLANVQIREEKDANEGINGQREMMNHAGNSQGGNENDMDEAKNEIKLCTHSKEENLSSDKNSSLNNSIKKLQRENIDHELINNCDVYKNSYIFNRYKENEKIKELHKNNKATNINIYKRMYQSYSLLKREYKGLINENRKKLEINKKLKYELSNLQSSNYYSNFFFKNDSDNLFDELASGISNIFKWMDIENKITQKSSGGNVSHASGDPKNEKANLQSGGKSEHACQDSSEFAIASSPEQEQEESKRGNTSANISNDGCGMRGGNGMSKPGEEKVDAEVHATNTTNVTTVPYTHLDEEPMKEKKLSKMDLFKSTIMSNFIPRSTSNDGSNEDVGKLISNKVEGEQSSSSTNIVKELMTEHDHNFVNASTVHNSLKSVNSTNMPSLCEKDIVSNPSTMMDKHERGTNSQVVKKANTLLEKVDVSCKYKRGTTDKCLYEKYSPFPTHWWGNSEQTVQYEMGKNMECDNYTQRGYGDAGEKKSIPKCAVRKEWGMSATNLASRMNDQKIRKNSFLWEKESTFRKRDIMYKPFHNELDEREKNFSKKKNDIVLLNKNCVKENIVEYIKKKLHIRSGSIFNTQNGMRCCDNVSRMVHVGSPGKSGQNVPQKEDKLTKNENDSVAKGIFHICNYEENKYVPLNLSNFFFSDEKKEHVDVELSINYLKKNMEFILNKKKKKNVNNKSISWKKCTLGTNISMTNGKITNPPNTVTNGENNDQRESTSVVRPKLESVISCINKEVYRKKKKNCILRSFPPNTNFPNSEQFVNEEKFCFVQIGIKKKFFFEQNRSRKTISKRKIQNCKLNCRKNVKVVMNKSDMRYYSKRTLIRIAINYVREKRPSRMCKYALIAKEEAENISVTVSKIKSNNASLPVSNIFSKNRNSCLFNKKYVMFRKNTYSREERILRNKKTMYKCDKNAFQLHVSKKDDMHEMENKGESTPGAGISKCKCTDKLCYEVSVEIETDEKKDYNEKGRHEGKELLKENTDQGDILEEGLLECFKSNGSIVGNYDFLIQFKEVLAEHILSLNILGRQIKEIENKNKDEVIIIGIRIQLNDKHILLFVDALNSVECTVRRWIRKNEEVLKCYIKNSTKISNFFKCYPINLHTFFCNFLSILENCVEQFPFYFSICFDDMFCANVQTG